MHFWGMWLFGFLFLKRFMFITNKHEPLQKEKTKKPHTPKMHAMQVAPRTKKRKLGATCIACIFGVCGFLVFSF
jgi:hypothetical protein